MSLDFSLEAVRPVEVFTDNITHNLVPMAQEAGVYDVLWHPNLIGVTYAKDAIPILQRGLSYLREAPERFKALNPSNGWGSYEGLVEFVQKALLACEEHPDAIVRAYT